jgi:hypothetical protein
VLLSIDDDRYEDVMAYNGVMDHIERQYDDESPKAWEYRKIISHSGPLRQDDPNYNGSSYNVMAQFETGEIKTEPLTVVASTDPVICAIYAKENSLLDTEGWKRFKRIARRQNKFMRMANQAKLRSYRTSPKYMYGYEFPRDYAHAVYLDEKNGNTRWQDATALELAQLDEYGTFKDMGALVMMPDSYKKINVHLVYAVKHD